MNCFVENIYLYIYIYFLIYGETVISVSERKDFKKANQKTNVEKVDRIVYRIQQIVHEFVSLIPFQHYKLKLTSLSNVTLSLFRTREFHLLL